MIKQLLNSVIAKYRDLSVSRRSIITDTDKSRYFAQPRPIIANYLQLHAMQQIYVIVIRVIAFVCLEYLEYKRASNTLFTESYQIMFRTER